MERAGRRLRRLRGGGIISRKLKKRAVSLDETVRSLQSLPLSDATHEPEMEESTSCRNQGASSKAAAVLLRRRVGNDENLNENDERLRAAATIQEQESPPPSPSSNSPAFKRAPRTVPKRPDRQQDPAVRARQEAIRAQQKLLGKHHPDVLFSLESLIRFHRERGEHKEALLVLEEKERLSRESYWNRCPREQGIPTNIVIAHE